MGPSSKRGWIVSITLSSTLLIGSFLGVVEPGNISVPMRGTESVLAIDSSLLTAKTVRYNVVSTAVKVVKNGENIEKVMAADAKTKTSVKTANKQTRQVSRVVSSEISRGSSSQVEEIVRNAQSLIGIPYVFGGTSTKGFDCSGFTQYVFKGSGIDLPRTSYAQYGMGTAVKKDQLQAGDLVFFSTYDKGASHVGIYIGGGSFIHAAGSAVKITSLSNSYYSPRYIGARRAL